MDIKVRIEAINSGNVSVFIYEPLNISYDDINFGFISSTMAECYGTIIATEVIRDKLRSKDIKPETVSLAISVNDSIFAEYILGETTPREKYKRSDIEYLRNQLKLFYTANINLYKDKQRLLKGSNTPKNIPEGIFPDIHINVENKDNKLYVQLPKNPAIINQFIATFKVKKSADTDLYILDESREKFLWAWIYTTKGKNTKSIKNNNDTKGKEV